MNLGTDWFVAVGTHRRRQKGSAPGSIREGMMVAHHSDGHECHPQAVNARDCDWLARLAVQDYCEGLLPWGREDASFWVPHQQHLGEFVEFDQLTSSIDDIIIGCGYREEDREWLTEVHGAATRRFLEFYEGPLDGPVPLLGDD